MKISLTIPSLDPDRLARTLTNLRDATRMPYEAIVVSPFEPPQLDGIVVRWVPENTPRGCNHAHALGFAFCDGDLITAWVDDHLYVDGWDAAAVCEFLEGEGRNSGKRYLLGLRQVWPNQVGTVFGKYYPYFPMMRRDRIFGWFNPAYLMDFADCDLAMRVYAGGGVAEWSTTGLIVVLPDDGRKNGREFHRPDLALFASRWHERYGAGWAAQEVRDFNLDVDLSVGLQWVDRRVRLEGRTAVPSGMP